MLHRRTLLGSAALATAALLTMTRCTTQTPSQLQADVEAISAGIGAVVTDLAAIPGVAINPATLAKINADIAAIQAQAAAIAAVLSPSADLLSGLDTALANLVPLLTPFYAAAPQVAATVRAAIALLNLIFAQAGLPAPAAATAALAKALPAAKRAQMSAEDARIILHAAARRAHS